MNEASHNGKDWGPLIPYHAPPLEPPQPGQEPGCEPGREPGQEPGWQAPRQAGGRPPLVDIPGWVPWGAGDILALIVLIIAAYFAVSIFVGVIVGVVTSLANVDRSTLVGSPYVTTVLLVLQWVIIFGIAIGYFRLRDYRFNLKTIGFRRPPSVLVAVLLAIGLMFAAELGILYYSSFVTPTQPPVTSEFSFSVVGFILAFIEVAILVPIVEESFFRGVIHQGMEKTLGFFPGAVASATIFALAHFVQEASLANALTIFVPIFILGFTFAWLMHHTHSLLPSIIGHFIFNAIAVIGQYFFLGS